MRPQSSYARATIRMMLYTAVGLSGCAQEDVSPPADDFRVELTALGQHFEVAVPTSNGTKKWAEMAGGAVLFPMRDGNGNPKSSHGTPLRASCGAIMVSPSYAVTAAHCVDAVDVPNPPVNPVTLEMYKPGSQLATGFLAAAGLSTPTGKWWDFQHGELDGSDGYVSQRFDCRVVVRCGGVNWGDYNCTSPDPSSDVALVKCSNKPGLTYGFVDIADSDLDDVPVFMPWAHEIYAIQDEPGDIFYDHYTVYINGNSAENIHYFGDDRNQLVPLRSKPWPGTTQNSKLYHWPSQPNEVVRYTDLSGCHGTSGSPVLQPDPNDGTWELLGPVAVAGASGWHDRLCQDPAQAGPGNANLGYSALRFTKHAVDQVDDCHELTQGKGLLFYLKCLTESMEWVEFDPFPDIWCLSCPLDVLRWVNEPMAVLPEGEPTELPMGLRAGARHRFAALASPLSGSALLAIMDETGDVLHEVELDAEGFVVLDAELYSEPGGSLWFMADGGEIGLTHVQLRNLESVNRFDDFIDRAGVGVVALEDPEAGAEPISFVDDGAEGFAALLDPGHRMVMTREALVGGSGWRVGFDVAQDSSLVCGFVLAGGDEMMQACTPEDGHVSVEFDATEQAPFAFFVQIEDAEGSVVIDNVAIEAL